ncbi:hypothetical protein EAE99_004514 [Botrytis elliptica]|nr:hypothetical protein EAE99_004514 [Botrytis elliptica]
MASIKGIETVVVLSLIFATVYIPGSKPPAITWWYEFYFDVVHQMFSGSEISTSDMIVFNHAVEFHGSGPMICVIPDELHTKDVGFLYSVYAPITSHRDNYKYQLSSLQLEGCMGTTASYCPNKRRRDALSLLFAKCNFLHLEKLPDLSAVIEERNCLSFGVTARTACIAQES